MIKNFKKIPFDIVVEDKDLQRELDKLGKIQDNIQSVLQPVLSNIMLNGILLREINLISGQTNVINHKLDRDLIGYIITKKNANSNIWDSQDLNEKKNLTLQLLCDVSCKVDLWVY